MADWKKLVVSGSTAELSGLTISNAVTASTFVGDGSNLTGINSGIFSETGSIQSTTNDLQVTGSLDVDGIIKERARVLIPTLLEDLVLDENARNVFHGDVMTDENGEAIIFDGDGGDNLFPLTGSSITVGSATIDGTVTANSFAGDGSQLTGVIVDTLFAQTGSIQSTTNDLQISGSLTVSGAIKDPTRTITTFADLFDSVTMVGGVNVVGGDVMTSEDGETIIFDSGEQGKFPLSGSSLFAEQATIDGTITATSFLGDGSQITNVDYTNLNNIPSGILSSSIVTIDPLGNMTVTSLTQTSARRYKKNIIELDSHNIIDQLKPVEFEWRRDGTKDYGFIAEEVDDIDPILTTRNDHGGLEGLKYSKIIPFLVKKVQDQDKEIQQLKELIKSKSL